MMKRLFIAIPISEDMRKASSRFKKFAAINQGRWVSSVHWHVTVLFLGNVDESYVEQVGSILTRVAEHTTSFELMVLRVGYVPEEGPAKMLWVQFEPSEEFLALVASLRTMLSPFVDLASISDEREVLPHLTLVRFKNKFLPGRKPLPHFTESVLPVSELQLVSSTLTNNGPHYETLESVKLGVF